MTATKRGAPPGGSFLTEDAAPTDIFTPEEFSPEARLMAQTADEFLRREILPRTDRIEAHDLDLMRDLMRRAGELGLLGAEVPEAYGGLGLDARIGALLAEKLNWQQSFALTHEAHTVIATLPLMYFGGDAQKSRYLPKLATGEWIGAFCLSEAGSGSDALGAQTRADLSPDGKEWVLNGTKMWITNTAFADLFTVFAKVDGDKFSAFLVERGTPGLSFGKEEHKLGMRGTSTRRVILENARIPAGNLVGEVGKGRYAAFCALNMGRFKLEAGAVGGIKETIAICARYATERRQFGRPLADFGLVRHKIGEMVARCFALESTVYRLAGLLDAAFEGIQPTAADAPARYHRAAEEYSVECGIVKVVGSELYSWATDEGIQIHGGYGYTEEFAMARAWRDQRLLRIGEGANEIVRLSIVSGLLRRAKQGRLDLGPATERARSTAASQDAPAARLKRAALLLLDAASRALGDRLLEEQEVAAAIADLASAAFAAESAALRADKLAGTGGEAAELARAAATTYGGMALLDARRGAEEAIARLQAAAPKSAPAEDAASILSLLTPSQPADLIGLRRTLAAAARVRLAYPWE